jgi:choice-of-anchor B domain-containing protein
MIRPLFICLCFSFLVLSSCGEDDRAFEAIVQDPDIVVDSPPDEVDLNDGRIPCENGLAGNYPCEGYDLMAHFSLNQLNAEGNGNDCWGWTDSTTGKEYAIMGVRRGTVFIDISEPAQPIILGRLTTATDGSTWRDIKVYKDHAFIVSEAANHGMQVFDLSKLRDTDGSIQDYQADAHYTEFGRAHNIVINEDTGYAYAVGTQDFDGGPHFINIQDPKNPVFEGGFAGGTYSHDAQVVTYNGPDNDYQGREVYIGSNEDEVVIIDVTDKGNPSIISRAVYSNIGFTHQGWLTEDHQYFIANDEFDETNFGFNTRSVIFDFTDLDNPVHQGSYIGPTAAIDHNYYTKGNQLYLANYKAGVRIVDITAIAGNDLFDIGFFDTFIEDDATGFDGAWSVYPYFESGNIIVSDMSGGLFIIRKSGT